MLSYTLSARCARRLLLSTALSSLCACTTSESPVPVPLDAGGDSSLANTDDSGAPDVSVDASTPESGFVGIDASEAARLDSRSEVMAPEAKCEIGVPDITGLAFADMGAEQFFPISGGGQDFLSMMLALRVTGLGDDLMVYSTTFVTGQEPEDGGAPEPPTLDATVDSNLSDVADAEAAADSSSSDVSDASLEATGPVFGAANSEWHARPVEADCGDDGHCDWVPLIVPLFGVAPENELECLPVTLRLNVDNGSMYCTTTVSGVLTREPTANSCTM